MPDSVDWRPKGYVTDIKNQVSLGFFSEAWRMKGEYVWCDPLPQNLVWLFIMLAWLITASELSVAIVVT